MSKRLKRWRRNVAAERYILENDPLSEPSESDFESSVENNLFDTDNIDCSVTSSTHSHSSTSLSSADSSDDSEEGENTFDNLLKCFASTSDTESDSSEEDQIQNELAAWTCRNDITRTSLNELLHILRNTGGHVNLPKDARTVLKTPKSVKVLHKAGGDYVYLGIESGILRTLTNISSNNLNSVKLLINADGIPIFKSSSLQVWPILGQCEHQNPFIIALFSGTSKPSCVDDYLSDFLNEYKHLELNGIKFGEKTITVKIKAILCDAPARQFLKGIKGHTGYDACERCQVKGEYMEHRIVFREVDAALRNDTNFHRMLYTSHQLKVTPLLDSSIQCMNEFPIDYMHLVCLGVVKRMLLFLKEGQRMCRLSTVMINIIPSNLERYKGQIPSELARQPRSLIELKRWKATEFRQFLLYTGPVVLRDVLSKEQLLHFRSLHVAMRIMLSQDDEHRMEHLSYSHDLLVYFVENAPRFYGAIFLSYNVHNLIHLHQDVRYFNTNLDNISCFPFENYLQVVKKFVRKGQNPICQIVKRVSEFEKAGMKNCSKSVFTKISSSQKDCWFQVGGNTACIKHDKGNKSYRCDVIKERYLESFYEEPCDSKLVGTLFVRKNNIIFESRVIKRVEMDT